MRSGDLKNLILSLLSADLGLSQRDLIHKLEKITKKEYAYSTISTVLSRLKDDKMVKISKAQIDGKTLNIYYLSENGYKNEINNTVKSIFYKFGIGGVKHLGSILHADISEEEIERLRKELN